MAELVDAPASGAGGGNPVEVQVLSRAPLIIKLKVTFFIILEFKSNSFDSYFGLGGLLAWLNLIGGIMGLLYYTFVQYFKLEKLKVKGVTTMFDQIKEAQFQKIIIWNQCFYSRLNIV